MVKFLVSHMFNVCLLNYLHYLLCVRLKKALHRGHHKPHTVVFSILPYYQAYYSAGHNVTCLKTVYNKAQSL
jgi:hypothetical protein